MPNSAPICSHRSSPMTVANTPYTALALAAFRVTR
jgi:hypothetical protein